LAFGKSIGMLFLFGLTLMVSGMLIMIFRGSLVSKIKDLYWIENVPFLQIMDVGWNVVPIIIFVLGVICLILGGLRAKPTQVVYE
jgi:TRAP-type C4-dicarboxylate transport system permease large subunit